MSREETKAGREQIEQFARDLEDAKSQANIDGFGDEGAGYDFEAMARLLIAQGYQPPREGQWREQPNI